MCFNIAKLWCLMLNIIRYFFSLFYAHAWYAKKKECAKKNKSERNQNTFKYCCKHVFRRCESYRMYLKGDSPHQAVIIVCELKLILSNHHNLRHLCTLAMFSHTTHIFFATFDTCAGTMWFGHHKEYMCWCMLTKLSWLVFEI